MIDQKLEEQITATQQLLQFWQRFHDYFAFGVKGTDVDQQREREFLQIKSQIAMLHDTFMEALTHDRNIGQNIMGICSRSITLKNLKKLSNADVQKMEIEWHESYLLLNETLGALQEKRQQMANINPLIYNTKRSLNNMTIRTGNVMKQGWAKGLIIFIVIGGIVFGFFAFGVVSVDMFRGNKYTEPIYKVFKNLNSSIPHDSISEVPRKTNWPGSEVKLEVAQNLNTTRIKNEFLHRNFITDPQGQIDEFLNKNLELYAATETQPDNSSVAAADIVMVRFNEIRDATEFIYRVNSEYNDYLNKTNQPRYMQAFSNRNVAILVSSADSDLSRQIRQKEFNQ